MTASVWHLYLRVSAGMGLLFSGQQTAAVDHFRVLMDDSESFGDPELQMLVRNGLGQSLVACGQVAEGLRLLDEVMVCVTTDSGISPQLVGLMYCAVIDACRTCFDLQRAREWTGELTRWCAKQPGLYPTPWAVPGAPIRGPAVARFVGRCLYRCGAGADPSCSIFSARRAAGMAHYQRGELHWLRGEHARAEASFRKASQCGRDPLPGLALLRLAEGESAAAWAAIRRAAGEANRAEPDRVRLLPAYIEIALAAGDVAAADKAAGELSVASGRHDSPYLSAAAAFAEGEVRLVQGRAVGTLWPGSVMH